MNSLREVLKSRLEELLKNHSRNEEDFSNIFIGDSASFEAYEDCEGEYEVWG
jgi:hypothetical protein